ncbi:hypothetical protein [Geofilum rubicundum]|uniref:Uncharacterized protein n=1 Tax=Geofilum rubicundum JCM 15548 TaxID=1236989 RepID=A0A0E9LZ72_9BACT|nr:hypothetical protein [Geofilum rubicundum]GAO30603.1 hypothetical protein JCM15548_12890 [Geofilum rubicundum JCM 15548]
MMAPSKTIKHLIFVPLLLLLTGTGHAQSLNRQIKFINHLTNSGYYEESLAENLRTPRQGLSQPASDSLNYLAGWAAYYLKELATSTSYLTKVSPSSELYPKSHLFAAYNQIHLSHYQEGQSILSDFKPQNTPDQHFVHYLSSGVQLLQRDLAGFDSTLLQLPKDYFGFSKELANLQSIQTDLLARKDKSVWLSGLLSAILPGSGKIYAGKTGQGITTFLLTTGLALVTFENYHKNGIESASTLLFGSAFTVFYAGNIYGSMYSAKTANDDFYHLQNQKILFNLHIPLRNIFD